MALHRVFDFNILFAFVFKQKENLCHQVAQAGRADAQLQYLGNLNVPCADANHAAACCLCHVQGVVHSAFRLSLNNPMK